MQSFIEPLYKSKNLIEFGWSPEPVEVSKYCVYVGLVGDSSLMTLLMSNISPQVSQNSGFVGKVLCSVTATSVQNAIALPSTVDFSNKVFYFSITYVDLSGVESSLADSRIVEVPPVGVLSRFRKEDLTANRYMFGFSDENQCWVKTAVSSRGGLITDPSDFFKANITTEYAYDGTNLKSTKSYMSDMTVAGAPAKLTTYEYSGSLLIKMAITDTTV